MITKEEQQRRLTIVRDGYVAMPEAKFAALIRHFGEQFFEDDEEAYFLKYPYKGWISIPEGTRVLAADNPEDMSIGFVCFVEKKKDA